jgi:hypothetical protein
MIVEVNHPVYGKTELNVKRIIAICPQKRWILFEECYWPLSQKDFDKVAEKWRALFDNEYNV